jgi:restriction system protein
MARRKKTNLLEDIFNIAAALPWWVGVTLAAVVFWYLDSLAAQPVPVATNAEQLLSGVKYQALQTFGFYGRFVFPFFLLAGSVASFFARRKRVKLLASARNTEFADPFSVLSWHDFELLVGQYFRELGYSVAETSFGADGGVDLRVKDGAETYLVQCKLWKASKVPVTVVRELYGVMMAEGASGAIVVTSGEFTPDAKGFAAGKSIVLVDGRLLVNSIRNKEPSSELKADIRCPLCGSDMLLRKARKGPNTGNFFYGCTRYPGCKGVRDAPAEAQRNSEIRV